MTTITYTENLTLFIINITLFIIIPKGKQSILHKKHNKYTQTLFHINIMEYLAAVNKNYSEHW
jgi:hypothetical protein